MRKQLFNGSVFIKLVGLMLAGGALLGLANSEIPASAMPLAQDLLADTATPTATLLPTATASPTVTRTPTASPTISFAPTSTHTVTPTRTPI
ncbi:MAG: hypothetical protein KIH69_020275, partial [Anaerolineae bacterium]|nr:hypothetical protein [Anaerolineae bacterium]